MKYLSLFSGYGGFELGIQQAYESIRSSNVSAERGGQKITEDSDEEWKGLHTFSSETAVFIGGRGNELPDPSSDQGQPHCVGFSEIDKYATQVYKKHFNHKEYGDITKIRSEDLPDFDLLVGGFPCQAFSIAGKRAGFEDTRGTLIFDVLRILKEKQPRLCVLENVKGLLSHDSGRTFKTIITSLAELGYAVEWQVLNAKNFGVPQNRERVFIVGHLGGFGGRQIFPIGRNGGKDIQKDEVREIYEPFPETHRLSDAFRIRGTDGISATLKGLGGGMGAKTGLYAIGDLWEKVYGIRRLTPTECERLMGLPDGWTEGVSDTQRYKLCGNGVVVNVVKEIIKKFN